MAGHAVPIDFKVNPAKISNPGKKHVRRFFLVQYKFVISLSIFLL